MPKDTEPVGNTIFTQMFLKLEGLFLKAPLICSSLVKRETAFVSLLKVERIFGWMHFCPQVQTAGQSATLEPNSAFDWLWESIVGVKHCSKTINMSMLSCPKWIEWNNVSDLSHL